MVGQVLTLSALVVLTHAKAIVTNQCKDDVYIWSVPVKPDYPENIPIPSGRRYEEPWRYGTSVNPGIAIKVSPEDNGINNDKSEIDFQYSIDPVDPKKIWINLSTVRGHAFGENVTLHTCHGPYKGPDVPTRQCSDTDDIELVLCGTERTTPLHDSTSLEVLAKCTEKLKERHAEDSPRPQLCRARVIGPRQPKRKSQPQGGSTNNSHDGLPATVPLKDVLRQEAAKHAATKTAEGPTCDKCPNPNLIPPSEKAVGIPYAEPTDTNNKAPLCDLLRKSFPGAMCDEATAEHNARLFYADGCGDKTKRMFPGNDCQEIRKEMKKVFPGVDKAVIRGEDEHTDYSTAFSKRRDLREVCIFETHTELGKYWGSLDNTRDMLEDIFEEIPFSLETQDCTKKAIKDTKKYYHKLVPGRRTQRCVMPYCRPVFPDAKCSDVEDVLEKVSKDLGHYDDWTTDDDACGEWVKRRSNDTSAAKRDVRNVCSLEAHRELGKYWGNMDDTESLLNAIFPDSYFTDGESECESDAIKRSRDYYHKLIPKKKTKKCVLPYCQPVIHGAKCRKVKKALEKVSKDVGKHYDWTSDNEACGEWAQWAGNHTSVARAQKPKDCIKAFCDPIIPMDCSDAEDLFEELFREEGVDMDWTTDDDVCRDFKARAAKATILDKRGRPKVCIKPVCNFLDANGKDCERVEDVWEQSAKDRFGLKIDYTTDDDVC